MKLTAEQVERALESFEYEGESGWYWWKYESDHVAGHTVPEIGRVRVIEEVGGGEGSGEEMYLIFSVVPGEDGHAWQTQFFRKSGYYASWDGSNWDGAFFEVEPTKHTVTIYQEVRR